MIFEIFESENPEQFNQSPRFQDHERVQRALRGVCEAWRNYLANYVKQTTKEFHGTPKLPWEEKERALVSTLMAAVARSYKKAAVISELPVAKKGTRTKTSWCDAWGTIPEIRLCGHSFSFYLEAKISLKPKPVQTLAKRLAGNYGIAKMFRDYEKNSGQRLRQKSPFVREKNRKHEHYSIAMLMIPIYANKTDLGSMRRVLEDAFTRKMKFQLKYKRISRTMSKYPTVGLIALGDGPNQPSMITSLTVLGCTAAFAYQTRRK